MSGPYADLGTLPAVAKITRADLRKTFTVTGTFTQDEADALYSAQAHNHDGVYASGSHTHEYTAASHTGSADPHSQYLTQAEADPLYTAASHTGSADPHAQYLTQAEADAIYASGTHTHAGGSEQWPVGSVFLSVVSTNPNTLLGYGTWSAVAAGKFLVGLDAGDADFDTAEETGGAKTHTLTTAEMPAHVHDMNGPTAASGGSIGIANDTNANGSADSGLDTLSAGGGGAHNNLPPYFVVYMWKRTA